MDAAGQLRLLLSGASNLLLDVSASDPDGLAAVFLQFGGGARFYICTNETGDTCPSDQLNETVSGLNPGEFDQLPGTLRITLTVIDRLGNEQDLQSILVDWQPPVISGVSVTRSEDATQIVIAWTPQQGILRYNVYLAAAPGLSRETFSLLPQGQAQFAQPTSPVTFSSLAPETTYFVLITGIDGGGESTINPEIAVPGGNGLDPNQPPLALDDAAQGLEDSDFTLQPLENDSDPDGDTLTIVEASAVQGTVTVNPTDILFAPPADFFGELRVQYTISDGNGQTANAEIVVTVNPVNDAPVAADDAAQTAQGTAVNIAVLDNDIDVDGDVLTVIDTTGGNAVIEADQSVTYTPIAGFTGNDTFDYTLSDPDGLTAIATVTVEVRTVNQPPQGEDDTYTLTQDTTLNVDAATGLLANDDDPDGDALTVNIVAVTGPGSGTLTLREDGGFDYTPVAGFSGVDGFDYEVVDPSGASGVASVTLTVEPPVDPLAGNSTSINGEFLYVAQGENPAGSGQGTGFYRVGNCIADTDTYCTFIGDYVEGAGSGNAPGEGGRYAFIQTYSGTGNSPVLARSATAGSNSVSFVSTGDARFELVLFPQSGGILRGIFPADPFANSIGFGIFIDTNQTCQGLPPAGVCNIGSVGLFPGAELRAPLDRMNFTLPANQFSNVQNQIPAALDDAFTVTAGQASFVAAPGVLGNDTDADVILAGDTLAGRSQLTPAQGNIIGLAYDQYRQLLYLYSENSAQISVVDRLGQAINTLNLPINASQRLDLAIAPQNIEIGGVAVEQGTLLLVNGQQGPAQLLAVNPVSGDVLNTLDLQFGNSQVVSAAYNPVNDSVFVLQNTDGGTGQANVMAQLNVVTGALEHTIQLGDPPFNLDFEQAALAAHPLTGNLYLVVDASNELLELTPQGNLVRRLVLPGGINAPLSLDVSADTDRIWLGDNAATLTELALINSGVLPQLVSELVTPPSNGTVEVMPDGSFVYTPNPGFTGQDEFVYFVDDQRGGRDTATVTVTVE